MRGLPARAAAPHAIALLAASRLLAELEDIAENTVEVMRAPRAAPESVLDFRTKMGIVRSQFLNKVERAALAGAEDHLHPPATATWKAFAKVRDFFSTIVKLLEVYVIVTLAVQLAAYVAAFVKMKCQPRRG